MVESTPLTQADVTKPTLSSVRNYKKTLIISLVLLCMAIASVVVSFMVNSDRSGTTEVSNNNLPVVGMNSNTDSNGNDSVSESTSEEKQKDSDTEKNTPTTSTNNKHIMNDEKGNEEGTSSNNNENTAEDLSTKDAWPELVGMDAKDAKEIIKKERPDLAVIQIVPFDAMVTADYRTDRVRVYKNDANKVARTPTIG